MPKAALLSHGPAKLIRHFYNCKVKRQYEHKESFYSFGWSHGKEKLQGRPDVAKGQPIHHH